MKRWIAPLLLLLALGGSAAAYASSAENDTPCFPECGCDDSCPFR